METSIIKIHNCKREDIDTLINELEKLRKKSLRRKETDDVKSMIKSVVELQDSLKNNKYVFETVNLKYFN